MKRARLTLQVLLGKPAGSDAASREFLEAVYAHRMTIIRICAYFTDRQPDNLRDLCQEIVCTLWEQWPHFRGRSSVGTWVYRVALNTAVSEWRQRSHSPTLVPLDERLYETLAEEVSKEPPDYYRLIEKLEPDERALLYMRLDRMSISEIALQMGISEAAVKQRLYRIRQKYNKTSNNDTNNE